MIDHGALNNTLMVNKVVRCLRAKAGAATRNANREELAYCGKYREQLIRAYRVRARAFKDAAKMVEDAL